MSTSSTVNAAVAFVDLATYSELEAFLYGGESAISYFVAGVQKGNWYSMVPVQLRKLGTHEFGASGVSASINRSGDYVLNATLRAKFPAVISTSLAAGESARWQRNLMHNLVKKCWLTFNELVVQEFDNYLLDFMYNFNCPASKRTVYRNMIGDVATMTSAIDSNSTETNVEKKANEANAYAALWGGYFSLPLPFFFSFDSGIALPAAALPYNDIKINYEFRSYADLLVLRGGATTSDLQQISSDINITDGHINGTGTALSSNMLSDVQTFATYAVVHNDERVRMGDSPRDMLINQYQTISETNIPSTATGITHDLRFSHAIVTVFWAMRNRTATDDGGVSRELSNYTTNMDFGVQSGAATETPLEQGGAGQPKWWNPISHTQIKYENSVRWDYDADFGALQQPFYFSPNAAGEDTGMHMMTYSLNWVDFLSPSGSTNFSKLANVEITHTLSNMAQHYQANNLENYGTKLALSSVLVIMNLNVARIANGSFGFVIF